MKVSLAAVAATLFATVSAQTVPPPPYQPLDTFHKYAGYQLTTYNGQGTAPGVIPIGNGPVSATLGSPGTLRLSGVANNITDCQIACSQWWPTTCAGFVHVQFANPLSNQCKMWGYGSALMTPVANSPYKYDAYYRVGQNITVNGLSFPVTA